MGGQQGHKAVCSNVLRQGSSSSGDSLERVQKRSMTFGGMWQQFCLRAGTHACIGSQSAVDCDSMTALYQR